MAHWIFHLFSMYSYSGIGEQPAQSFVFLSDPQGSVSSEYKVQKKLFEHLEKSRQ